jgi:hypothetical protein
MWSVVELFFIRGLGVKQGQQPRFTAARGRGEFPPLAPAHGDVDLDRVVMILPQVHLRKPCYDFTFL